jgi:hypothetical protein
MFLTDNPALRRSITPHVGVSLKPDARLRKPVPRSTSPSSIRPNLFSGD